MTHRRLLHVAAAAFVLAAVGCTTAVTTADREEVQEPGTDPGREADEPAEHPRADDASQVDEDSQVDDEPDERGGTAVLRLGRPDGMPDRFPEQMPTLEDAVVTSTEDGGGAVHVHLTLDVDVAALDAFFAAELPAAGWEVLDRSEVTLDDAHQVLFEVAGHDLTGAIVILQQDDDDPLVQYVLAQS